MFKVTVWFEAVGGVRSSTAVCERQANAKKLYQKMSARPGAVQARMTGPNGRVIFQTQRAGVAVEEQGLKDDCPF